MDPYLEGDEWTSVHTELSAEIARQLAPKLRPKYVVRTTRRFVTEMIGEVAITTTNIYPDVSVLDTSSPGSLRESQIAVKPVPLELATVIPTQIPLVSLEIRDVANRELVTALEVLSPTNKRGEGYQEYLDKRGRILHSSAHLIEIDLLRQGRRVPMQQPLPTAPYFVFVSRVERRPIIEVWPIQLNMQLPTIPVPLHPDDPEIVLDLQLALNTIYDDLSYDLTIDYTHPPKTPLEGELATWAVDLLY
jgi:hypothetical protein